MKSISLRTRNLMLAVVATVAVSVIARADEWKPSLAYVETTHRVHALSVPGSFSVAEQPIRLAELEAAAGEIERTWRDKYPEAYGRLTRDVCGALGSLELGNSRQLFLAQSFAMRALELADRMTLEVECELVGSVQTELGDDGKPQKGDALARIRRQQAACWLHAWERIDKTIDDQWDPNDTGVGNVMPPSSTGAPAGVAPESIADPKLRKDYEQAIEANRKKIERATLQLRTRALRQYWTKSAERFLIWAYSQGPDGQEELRGLLEKHVSDAARRQRILAAVANKQLPEELKLRNTTRPAPDPR